MVYFNPLISVINTVLQKYMKYKKQIEKLKQFFDETKHFVPFITF